MSIVTEPPVQLSNGFYHNFIFLVGLCLSTTQKKLILREHLGTFTPKFLGDMNLGIIQGVCPAEGSQPQIEAVCYDYLLMMSALKHLFFTTFCQKKKKWE